MCNRYFGTFNKFHRSRVQQQQLSCGLIYLGRLLEAKNTEQYKLGWNEIWEVLRNPYRGLVFAPLSKRRSEDVMGWLRDNGQLSDGG